MTGTYPSGTYPSESHWPESMSVHANATDTCIHTHIRTAQYVLRTSSVQSSIISSPASRVALGFVHPLTRPRPPSSLPLPPSSPRLVLPLFFHHHLHHCRILNFNHIAILLLCHLRGCNWYALALLFSCLCPPLRRSSSYLPVHRLVTIVLAVR